MTELLMLAASRAGMAILLLHADHALKTGIADPVLGTPLSEDGKRVLGDLVDRMARLVIGARV